MTTENLCPCFPGNCRGEVRNGFTIVGDRCKAAQEEERPDDMSSVEVLELTRIDLSARAYEHTSRAGSTSTRDIIRSICGNDPMNNKISHMLHHLWAPVLAALHNDLLPAT